MGQALLGSWTGALSFADINNRTNVGGSDVRSGQTVFKFTASSSSSIFGQSDSVQPASVQVLMIIKI